MENYTTLDAIGDIVVIYAIVIFVSMMVAVVIRGIVWALSRQVQPGEKAPVKPAASPPPAADTGIPQEHLVAIAAAVTAAMGAHRVVRIDAPGRNFGWTSEARAAHHSSHAPRRR